MTFIRSTAVLALTLAGPATGTAEPRFEDARAAFPAEHFYTGDWEHFVGGGIAAFDCNDDAWPDIYAAGGTSPASLFVNNAGPDLSFSEAPDLPPLTGVTGAYPIDINGDRQVDLVVLRVGQNRLLQGLGDCRFEDATDSWGFATDDRWSTAFTATWEPENTWPTLAIGNYVDRSNPDGPFQACDINQLYRPSSRGYEAPINLEPGYCALSMLFSDWTRSGRAELRISNDRHYYVRGGYEQMWRLDPLAERTAEDGWDRVSLWGMGIASADLQGDGFPDVMLTSMGDQMLMFNAGGTISAAPFDLGTTAHRPHIGDDGRPATGWHAEFGDVDNDGRLDLFIAKGNVDQMPSNAINDPNNLLMQQTDGRFVEAAATAGIASVARSRGASLVDLDLDGRLDLVVVNRRAPMEVWLNRSPDTGNWATIDLETDGPNRFAIGAWLEIRREDETEWRERTIGGGHVSGTLLPLHIGMGEAETVQVRVHWPEGGTTDWFSLSAGERLLLRP